VGIAEFIADGPDRLPEWGPQTLACDHRPGQELLQPPSVAESPAEVRLLVTPEEAAGLLSIGRTTVYELISRGELQSVHIGRSRRVPVGSLVAYVRQLLEQAHGA
jgi:excisionase family DNA binding protein